MSLRDYFAAKAMQAAIQIRGVHSLGSVDERLECKKRIAMKAYEQADAMMEVRDKVSHPLDSLRAQIQADDDLAWTWHCNVAVCFMDEGGSHKMAQHAAARFMQTLFGVDVTKFVEWQKYERQWASIEESKAK